MHVYNTNKTSTQNRKKNQPFFEESDKINRIVALQYPPKVHLSRDVYSNSFKSGWSHFRKNLKPKKSQNPKIQKSENPKIGKAGNPNIRTYVCMYVRMYVRTYVSTYVRT